MLLSKGKVDTQYIIQSVETNDKEMKDFLFSLGCYSGESITIISKLAGNFIISIKDARYSIDENLAKAIRI